MTENRLRHWPVIATAVTLIITFAAGAFSVVDQLGRHDERITKLEQDLNSTNQFIIDNLIAPSMEKGPR